MSYGLEIWDSNGTKILNVADSITRFFTSFTLNPNVNGTSGYVYVQGLTAARGWVSFFSTGGFVPAIQILDNYIYFAYTSTNAGTTYVTVGSY